MSSRVRIARYPYSELALNVASQGSQKAGQEPKQIPAVEPHGTGTPVGDPTEYESIRLAIVTLDGKLRYARSLEDDAWTDFGTEAAGHSEVEFSCGIMGPAQMLTASSLSNAEANVVITVYGSY